MSSTAFDALSFSEPASISSRQFLTNSYRQHPSDGEGRFYSPGQQTRLEISGMSQNTFILPNTFHLQYYALSQPQINATAAPAVDQAQQIANKVDFNQVDGCPFFGAPHLGSVSTEVPGLSSQFSSLTSDGYSQLLYTTRLLCSGDEGRLAVEGDAASYEGTGSAWEAGARSYLDRALGVQGASFRANYAAEVTATLEERWSGTFQKYKVPASAWFSLCDGATSVLPLPYLTNSSSNLIVQINWAPATSALCNGLRPRAVDALTYRTTGVSLGWTAVSIVDASILAKIQALFRGQVQLPIMSGGVSIPVPMTLCHRAIPKCAATTLAGASGSVSLRVPAGMACVNAVVVRIMPEDGAVSYDDNANLRAEGKFASHHLVAPRPIISDLQLEIGSGRFPARPISDTYFSSGIVPPGLATSKWATAITTEADARNDAYGGATYIPTSDEEASEAYRLGRMHMSLFDNDKFESSPAAQLYRGTRSDGSALVKAQIGTLFGSTGARVFSSSFKPLNEGLSATETALYPTSSPGLFVFNLQSLLQEESMKMRGGQLSGVDLRNQSDVTVSLRILGAAPQGTNLNTTTGTGGLAATTVPAVSGWRISCFLCATELATILPNRTDLAASASLLASAAGAVASGS